MGFFKTGMGSGTKLPQEPSGEIKKGGAPAKPVQEVVIKLTPDEIAALNKEYKVRDMPTGGAIINEEKIVAPAQQSKKVKVRPIEDVVAFDESGMIVDSARKAAMEEMRKKIKEAREKEGL